MFTTIIPSGAGQAPVQAARSWDLVTVATLGVAAFASILMLLTNAGVVGHPSDIVNAAGLIGLGALGIGVPASATAAQSRANIASIEAAHKRLDAVGAPPADDGTKVPAV